MCDRRRFQIDSEFVIYPASSPIRRFYRAPSPATLRHRPFLRTSSRACPYQDYKGRMRFRLVTLSILRADPSGRDSRASRDCLPGARRAILLQWELRRRRSYGFYLDIPLFRCDLRIPKSRRARHHRPNLSMWYSPISARFRPMRETLRVTDHAPHM